MRSRKGGAVSRFDPSSLCQPSLCDITPYQPGRTAEQIEAQFGVRNAVKLASNENLAGPGECAVRVLTEASPDAGFYPDSGGRELKRLLAKRHGVAPDQITLGNGSNEVIELVGRCFLAAGKGAVYSRHAFAVYPLVTRISGANAQVAPARAADDGMPYGHDLAAMLELAGRNTAVVFIANPNNPTGTWLTSSELHEFIRALPGHVVVVVDEAYAEYVNEAGYPDCTQWLGEFPNLVVTRTFSKLFALAGLRIGYALSSADIAGLLNRLRQPFNVNALAQKAAAAALFDRAHIDASIAANREGLALLGKGLRDIGVPCLPSVANFVCCEVGDAAAVYERLLHEGIIVRPVAEYNLPRHLRVTVGLPEHNARFLDAMKRVMA